jgi:hypothetical protein
MKIVNAQYIVVKISKNEYFHSLVRTAYLFGVKDSEHIEKVRDAYPTGLRSLLDAMLAT